MNSFLLTDTMKGTWLLKLTILYSSFAKLHLLVLRPLITETTLPECSRSLTVSCSKWVEIFSEGSFLFQNYTRLHITDYKHLVRKSPELHSRKSTSTLKVLVTAKAYLVCHISPNFQMYLICLHLVFVVCSSYFWSINLSNTTENG